MADSHSTTDRLVPAAAYIRMSGRTQDKSPAEQRTEISKLAAREGFAVVAWYTDEAITGDSSTEARAGLADLLAAAKARTFKTLLAWHTNRVSREDPMDAVVFYNQLRRAGVGLWTCCEGRIDLQDFAKQLLLFVNQKASNDYLSEHSAKTMRGRVATAKMGAHSGGRPIYGMDRAEFDAERRLVRRLRPGEVHARGNQVRLIPTTDASKIEAVRFAFERMDTADLSLRELSTEMNAKGFPAPAGGKWIHSSVFRLLTRKVYMGAATWGETTRAKYHSAVGENIVPVPKSDGNGKPDRRRKPEEDTIIVPDAVDRIIDPKQFARVQHKLAVPGSGTTRRRRTHHDYPLSGLIFCAHCGERMQGTTENGRDRNGKPCYRYLRYVCSTYSKHGRDGGCGHYIVDARRVLAWLVHALQERFLGPGRDALVQAIKAELKATAATQGRDVGRLTKRAADLDKQVGRLVKAIRTVDASELAEELVIVRAERDRVRAELQQAERFADPLDLDAEAEATVDELWHLGESLGDADPAVLREVLRQFVHRIDCSWKPHPTKSGRTFYKLAGGKVQLRPQAPIPVSTVVAHTTA